MDDWTHARKKNYGLAVKASTTDSKGWKQFGSDDYPNGKPSLDVTWTKYGATYKLGDFTAPVTAVTEGSQQVTVTNRGQETWPAGGNYKLRYNLYDASGNEITDLTKIRSTTMPQAISPGESITLDAKIAPLTPATYTVEWTMDDAGVSRFTTATVPGASVKLSSVNIPPQLTAESPSSGVTVNTLTPTLWAKGSDADRYPKSALQYSFEVCEVAGSNLRKNCKTGTRTSEQQGAVPTGWLSWNKTYAWYAYAYDGAATSTRPGAALISTEVPQPAVTSHLGGADDGKEIGTREGNYVTAATDAALTTVGPDLSLTRTYNSLDPRTGGAFGTGWSTRWDMQLRQETTTSSVLVTLADGSQVRFGKNTDGTYTGPAGGSLTLARQSTDWVLRERSGTTYRFLASGVLSKITDAAGRGQTVTHDTATSGPVKTVTDNLSGRSLSFGWSGGHVTSVTTSPVDADTPGLTWVYHYTGSELTSVCPPTSTTKCTLYEYGSGSVYRSVVQDSAPTSYWRLGEGEGSAAASSAVSRTGLNDAVYRDAVLGGDSATAGSTDASAGFDGVDSIVELPTDTLKTAAFPTIELWFKTTTPSGVLVGFQNEELGEKPASWRPVLNIDGSGKLRGEFYLTGSPTPTPIVTPAAVTDGTWHHAVLTAAANTQSLYLDGVKVGTLTGALTEQSRDYAYLGAGYGSSGWMGLTEGDYHFKGQMDEVAFYDHTLDAATITDHYAARASIGQITKVTLPTGRVHATAAYDPATGRLTQHTDDNGGTWKVSAPSYSPASATYADTIQRSGPTGYWRLGERGGAEAASPLGSELAGSYLDGTRLGSPGVFADGDDTAVTFDKTAAIELPAESLGTSTAMSLELWFKTSDPGVLVTNQNADFGDTPTGARPILLIDSDGKLRGRFWGEATSVLSKAAVTDDTWHHVLLTGNEGYTALFVDGTYQGGNATGVPTDRFDHVYVGGGYSSTSWDGQPLGYRNFTGEIDEVAFYDKALVTFQKTGSTWSYVKPTAGSTDLPTQHVQARRGLVQGRGDQYDGVALADAPSAYYRLNETSGTALGSEIGGSPQKATFKPDSASTSKLDQSGVFGPGDDRAVTLGGHGVIQLPATNLTGARDLSAEMWFKTTSPSAVLLGFQNTAVGQTPTSWRSVLNIDGSGKLRGEWYLTGDPGATPIVSTQKVTDGQWHHVVLSGATNTQTLYLDGVAVGTLAGTIDEQAHPYTYVGGGHGTPGWMGLAADTYYFSGQVDEVALYRNALTADQVSAHYRAQAEAADSGLTATVTVTDPKEQSSTTSYDTLRGQRVMARKDATGAVTSYAYDTAGNLHTITDPNGHTTVTGHDARGNVVSTTTCRDANSCWTGFTSYQLNTSDPLDPRNDKVLSVSDQRSTDYKDTRYRTAYTYNAQGLPLTTVRADKSTAAITYTTGTETAVGGGTAPPGLVLTQTTPAEAKTSYRYFANGDTAEATSPSGLVTSYTYDQLGRKTSETQISDTFTNGVTTTYAYDEASNVVTETGAGVKNEITGTTHTGQITRTFDEDGNLLSQTAKDTTGNDPERVTTYHYNAHGLNDSVTDPEQNTTLYDHDETGQVTGTTDAAATHVTYTYTPRGQHATTVLHDWTGDPSGTVHDLTTVSNAYDPAGRLASTTDAMGATTAYTYFDDGLPATTTARQVTQADGSKHDIILESDNYDPAGHLTKQVTGGGATTQTYTVDALGRTTTSVLDPDGLNRTSTLTYDGDDRVKTAIQSITADRNLTTSAEYDAAGNPTKQTVTDGTTTHTTTSTYDDRGLPLTTVSPRGNTPGADAATFTTTNRYDALGRLAQQTAPPVRAEQNGGTATTVQPTTLTGYNTFGEATETKDPRNQVTRTEVDRLGRAVAATLPDYTPPGGTTITATTSTTYDPFGRPATVTDPLGRVTRYGYDQLGNLTSQTDPAAAAPQLQSLSGPGLLQQSFTDLSGGGVSRYTWTPTGQQLSATGPSGARTEATYDEIGRGLTSTTVERYPNIRNLTSRYTWDDASNQTASMTPGGITGTAAYNAAGEITSTTDPAGTTRFDYDGLGRLTETTDATNRTTTTTYNALSNVTAATDYGTGTTALRTLAAEFDADGNRTAAISATTKARTTYAYDALGQLVKQVEPVSGANSITTTFGYDTAGNRTRLTDGRGNSTTYTFTPWGLPESTVEPSTAAHPNAADRTWTTLYDKVGQPVTELLPGGVKRERTYDALGRLTHETGTGAEAATTNRTLEYDLAGNQTAAASSDPLNKNTYTYNDRGQLLTANGPAGTSSYNYDDDGHMTHRQTKAGSADYAYDNTGRLDWAWDSVTGNGIWYDYDAAGRPSLDRYATQPSGTATWTESQRRTYGYDDLGRLTTDKVTKPDGTGTLISTTYGYDLDERLISKSTTGMAGESASTYAYDDAGRMNSWTQGSTTTAYEWDAAGNRTKAGSASATYDARNRQLTDGSVSFTYSPRGSLSAVDDGSGTPRTLTFDAFERKITDAGVTYSYDSLDRLQTRGETTFAYDGGSNNLADDGTSTYNRNPAGGLLSSSTGTTKQWALTDQHTDLIAGLTPDGTQLASSTAYDPFGTETATNGTTPATGYQSSWTDPNSGDINMAARWYQPGTGSFASRDTWQLDPTPSTQANRYTYGNGGPLNGTDPTGHCFGPVIVICGAALGEAFGWGVFATVLAGGGALATDKYLRTHSDAWSNSYAQTNVLTNNYANEMADALRAQARGFSKSSGRTGGRSGGSQPPKGGVATPSWPSPYPLLAGAAAIGGLASAAIRPPRPVIDQNPNNGPHPKPAPTRPAPKPDWDPKNGGWKPGDAINMVIGAAKMLNLVNNDQFDPDQEPSMHLAPGASPDSGNDRDNSNDCSIDGDGWVEYQDTDTSRGGRSQGVIACLTPQYLNTHQGTPTAENPRPPGYTWARKYAGHLGANPRNSVNNCHLLGSQLTGSGTNLKNLSTCGRDANTYPEKGGLGAMDNMVQFENKVQKSIEKGEATVLYSVRPVYLGNRVTPQSYEMQATTWDLNGNLVGTSTRSVQNLMNTPRGWHNLGRVVHSRSGADVPTS
ncbi:LamG-like jellyroll fold domain-containing protein [Streptomyces sp. NPDC048211]|uniref:LamG-like jellyroll fold domain-containing protein n=1 Tax=Streptomyces sp. NPDC048211 TaxID=3365516 RepID=UPI003716177B